MNNKHKAAIAVAVLIVVFGLLFWYMSTHPAPQAGSPGNEASSTAATTTAPVTAIHIKESAKFYDIDAAYPSATPFRATAGAEADAAAITAIRGFEQNTIDAFKENSGLTNKTDAEFAQETFGRDSKYALTIEYKTYEGPKTVSYDFLIYEDTMGAHPNTYHRTFTFDRATGEGLELGDLFIPTAKYLDRMSKRTRADLPAIMAKMAETTPDQIDRDFINTGTMAEADSFGNFVIDGSALVMIFPPYQVGPYVYGTIEDPIPLSALNDILKPAYKP